MKTMKKWLLVAFTFVPILVGYLINRFLLLPVIGSLLFYVLPLATTVFWFFLGRWYGRSSWKTVPAILIGNGTGLVSLIITFLRYLPGTPETGTGILWFLMNQFQLYTDAAPIYLLAKIALLFEPQPNYMGRASMTALQVLSVIYMIAVFLLGFFWERRKKTTTADYSHI